MSSRWENFVTRLDSTLPGGKSNVVLGEAYGLYAEACKVFDVCAWAASAVLCRAAVESAGYLFLTRKPQKNTGAFELQFPRTLSGRVRVVQFEEIKEGLRDSGVLPKDLSDALDLIQKDGNFVAHLAAKQDADFDRVTKNFFTRVSQDASAQPTGSRMSVTEEEAKRDLDDTAEILLALAAAVEGCQLPRKSGSHEV